MELQLRSHSALGLGTKWTFVHSLQNVQNTCSQQPAHLWVSTSLLELFINCRVTDIHRVLPYKVTTIGLPQSKQKIHFLVSKIGSHLSRNRSKIFCHSQSQNNLPKTQGNSKKPQNNPPKNPRHMLRAQKKKICLFSELKSII